MPPPHATVSASGASERSEDRGASLFRGFMGGPEDRPEAARAQDLELDEPASARELSCRPTMPFRSRYLFVCSNRRPDGHPKGSCAEKGSEEIVVRLKEALARRGINKTLVRSCSTSCLDLCEVGVSVLMEPEHVAYGRVTLADVDAIADAAEKGEIVHRLVVHGPGGGAS